MVVYRTWRLTGTGGDVELWAIVAYEAVQATGTFEPPEREHSGPPPQPAVADLRDVIAACTAVVQRIDESGNRRAWQNKVLRAVVAISRTPAIPRAMGLGMRTTRGCKLKARAWTVKDTRPVVVSE